MNPREARQKITREASEKTAGGLGGAVSPPVGSRGKAPCRIQRRSPGKFLVYKVSERPGK